MAALSVGTRVCLLTSAANDDLPEAGSFGTVVEVDTLGRDEAGGQFVLVRVCFDDDDTGPRPGAWGPWRWRFAPDTPEEEARWTATCASGARCCRSGSRC